jgi:uncharacterized protein
MYLTSSGLVLSATDLVAFVTCEHLTQLELSAAQGTITRPDRDDESTEVLRRRGEAHELRYLQFLRDSGLNIEEIARSGSDPTSLRAAHDTTVEAMQRGVDVVYQAALFDGRWLGYADFLLRVESPSALGNFSYEVADTKLARGVKATAILQMCSYSEQLAQIQGREPDQIHVVLGDMSKHSYRLRDYSAYYRSLKARFESTVLVESIATTYPDPIDHCNVCRWSDICDQRRRNDDHLSLIARMRRDQIGKLQATGITTVVQLAQSSGSVVGIGTPTLSGLRDQARLQVGRRETGAVSFELLAPQSDSGLSLLPKPSPGDLFFDMEGDPYVEDGGLEYLFGVIEIAVDGTPRYQGFWAHDRAEEKQALEDFVDLVTERLTRDPNLHIYHYAPYEPTTLKRLMGVHATRELEIDQLLRGRTFVDLYGVVRQGIRVSQESYSLKQLEPLYMAPRDGEITDGGDSIVAYERWLEGGERAILHAIATYNELDCVSTWKLRDWLEGRRRDVESTSGVELERPNPETGEASEALRESEAKRAALTLQLSAGVPHDAAQRTPEQQGRWLLGQLLHWHRREDKPEWYFYFDRLQKTDAELVEDSEAIGDLDYVGVVGEVGKSNIHRYSFDAAQEYKLSVGKDAHDPHTRKSAGEIVGLDPVAGTIDLKRGKSSKVPHPRSLIPGTPRENSSMRAALARTAEWVVANDIEGPGPYQAARDLLRASQPRVAGAQPGESLRRADEPPLEAARRLVAGLDSSYLPIQGPPGTGKTFTAARIIVELVRAGKRVGISGPSHRAIANLLDQVAEEAAILEFELHAVQKSAETERCSSQVVECTAENARVDQLLLEGAVDVVAGTAWLFAREEMASTLDVLFVDEAGQVSLANTVAIAGAAQNLVLLGDPQQLPQPLKGSHPTGTELSALAHVLHGASTIASDQGLLLDTTWRMHPEICEFISDVAYDGELTADPSCAIQLVADPDDVDAGRLQHLAVIHASNRTASPEEAGRVALVVGSLLGRTWRDRFGGCRPLELADILVVAPYNAQVATLARHLPEGARVGTVDMFQGQEAAVAIFSTGASSAEDVPRGMEFLFNLNRLNVAISRARGLAILVTSPTLLQTRCRTPEQMQMLNAFCRLVELARVTREQNA